MRWVLRNGRLETFHLKRSQAHELSGFTSMSPTVLGILCYSNSCYSAHDWSWGTFQITCALNFDPLAPIPIAVCVIAVLQDKEHSTDT